MCVQCVENKCRFACIHLSGVSYACVWMFVVNLNLFCVYVLHVCVHLDWACVYLWLMSVCVCVWWYMCASTKTEPMCICKNTRLSRALGLLILLDLYIHLNIWPSSVTCLSLTYFPRMKMIKRFIPNFTDWCNCSVSKITKTQTYI